MQYRAVIPETRLTNKLSPTMAPAFCQEVLSGPQCKIQNKTDTGSYNEFKKQMSGFRKVDPVDNCEADYWRIDKCIGQTSPKVQESPSGLS